MQQAALAATAAKAAAKTATPTTGDINANAAANTAFSAMALASSSRGSRTHSSSPNNHKMHAQVRSPRNQAAILLHWL